MSGAAVWSSPVDDGDCDDHASSRCILLAGRLASCSDGIRNHNETGVDCGGPCSVACASLPSKHRAGLLLGSSTVMVAGAGGGVVLVAIAVAFGVRRMRSHREASPGQTQGGQVRPAAMLCLLCFVLLCFHCISRRGPRIVFRQRCVGALALPVGILISISSRVPHAAAR